MSLLSLIVGAVMRYSPVEHIAIPLYAKPTAAVVAVWHTLASSYTGPLRLAEGNVFHILDKKHDHSFLFPHVTTFVTFRKWQLEGDSNPHFAGGLPVDCQWTTAPSCPASWTT